MDPVLPGARGLARRRRCRARSGICDADGEFSTLDGGQDRLDHSCASSTWATSWRGAAKVGGGTIATGSPTCALTRRTWSASLLAPSLSRRQSQSENPSSSGARCAKSRATSPPRTRSASNCFILQSNIAHVAVSTQQQELSMIGMRSKTYCSRHEMSSALFW